LRDRPSPEGVLDIKSKQRESQSGIHRFFYSIERRIDCRLPRTIKTDNGSEFISKVMDKWAYERGVPPTMK
jgi:transposase InsO family protein